LELLIRNGCDVNIVRNNGRTPTYVASAEGNPICLQMIIAFGADVNKPDKLGRTPLLAAATGYEEIKNILRKNGAIAVV
jgi:26S proteasome non-ATPase regulatory subunit 10